VNRDAHERAAHDLAPSECGGKVGGAPVRGTDRQGNRRPLGMLCLE